MPASGDFTETTFLGELRADDVLLLGLPGARVPVRFVGGTASGAPSSGTFVVGDVSIAQDGTIWICITAGSPGTWTALQGGASSGEQWLTVTADYTMSPGGASAILADATSSNLVITLPTALGALGQRVVKKKDASAHTVTVVAPSGQTIDGGPSYVLSTPYESVGALSDGADWFIT